MGCPQYAVGCGSWSTTTNSCRESNCHCCQELDPCINVKTGLPGSDGLEGTPGQSITLRDTPLTVTISPATIINIDTSTGLTLTDNGSGEATIGFVLTIPPPAFNGARQGLTENAGYIELGAASWQTTGGSVFGVPRFVNANYHNFALTSGLMSLDGTENIILGGTFHSITPSIYIPATPRKSAIIAGTNSILWSSRSVILGGSNILGTEDDYVYVPNFNINYQPLTNNALTEILVRDPATGNVYLRSASTLGGGNDDFAISGAGVYTVATNAISITINRQSGNSFSFVFPLTGIAGGSPPPYLWKIAAEDTVGDSSVPNGGVVNFKKGTGLTSITRVGNDITINAAEYDAAQGISKNGNNFELGASSYPLSGYGLVTGSRYINSQGQGFVYSDKFTGSLGFAAMVLGGSELKNTGSFSFSGGGLKTRIDGFFSAIVGGEASAINPGFTHSFIAAGKSITMGSSFSFSTGELHQNNADYTFTHGIGAFAYYVGERTLGGSANLSLARHQGSEIVMSLRSTRGAGVYYAFSEADLSGDGLLLMDKSDYSFKGNVVGRSDNGTAGAAFDIVVHAKVTSSVMSIVSSSVIMTSSYGNGSGWDIIVQNIAGKLQVSASSPLDDARWTLYLSWAQVHIN